MNLRVKDTDVTVEKLKQKYLERRKQLSPSEDMPRAAGDVRCTSQEVHRGPSHARITSEAVQRLISAKRPSKELKSYDRALHELFKAVTHHHPNQFASDCSLQGSDDDLSGESTAAPLQDSQLMFTETDVTLPSCLHGSPGSLETEADGRLQRVRQLPDSCRSSSLVLAEVYQEMMTIYEQLKAERQSQQQWEKELQERETKLKQQEEAFGRLAGLEEMLHTRILAVEEKHQREVSQLQDLVRERSKENRRLKSSFDTIKELNDNTKKQLDKITEQNKKLESQSKRVQARLENLQRKYEHSIASGGCQKMSVKSTECVKPTKMKKIAASGKPNKGSSSPAPPKLLTLLMDWILDGQTFSSVAANQRKGMGQCLPPEVLLNERCLKVLPLLADQLHLTPTSEPDLLLHLLRLIHWVLRHMDNSTQHVALSATLRRIGEEVSKPPAQSTAATYEDPVVSKFCGGAVGGVCRSWPLYRSPCPHTRILSTLIVLRTVTQADVLAQALDSLHTELMSEESRGLFIHYGGVCVLLWMIRAGRGGLNTPVDILMQLTEQSRKQVRVNIDNMEALPKPIIVESLRPACYLNAFLDACSCEEFFRTASQLLKNPRLELTSLEKLSILLQKLSSIRMNRRLFELSSLHLQIQELNHKTNHTHTFLCLNLRSILHNLK